MSSTEVPSQVCIPPGYCKTTLGEVTAEAVSQAGPTGPFVYLDIGSVDRESKSFVGPKILNADETPSRARQVVQAGDVLVSMTRPNLNAVAMVLEGYGKAIASTGFHVLRSRWVDSKFLYYLVQTEKFIDAMSAVVQGALYPAVRPKDISGFSLNLPPRAEQTRIIAMLEGVLSDLDAGVAELKAAHRKLEKYRHSLLKTAVEGALTADWRAERAASSAPQEAGSEMLQRILTERRARWEQRQLAKFSELGRKAAKDWRAKYRKPVAPSPNELRELPEGWVWATLSQIGWLDRGRSQHRPRNAMHLYGGPFPFVQTGDIRHSETILRSVEATYSDAGLAQSKLWPVGTMCITIAANIGKTAILGMEACFPDSVVGFLPVSNEVSVRYVEYFMRTAQQALEDEAPATAQKNINLEILERLRIPLPPPAEQMMIVEILDELIVGSVDQERAVAMSLSQATAQRKNILKAAFAGQLVPQDPNDEPASVLLDRIRVARSVKGAAAPKRRGRETKERA